jgi:hypothetical protein
VVKKDRAVIVNKLNKIENATTIVPDTLRKSTEVLGIVIFDSGD